MASLRSGLVNLDRERLPSLFHVKLITTSSGQPNPQGRHSACDPAAVCPRRGCEERPASRLRDDGR